MAKFISPKTPDMAAPRYSGLATFMRTPVAETLDDLDIALVGIPYDGALTNRPGARHGPQEVRNQSSLMRSINHATRVDPYALCRVADVGDVPFHSVFDIEKSHADVRAFIQLIADAGVIPLSCGGDHSVTHQMLWRECRPALPTFAILQRCNLTVVNSGGYIQMSRGLHSERGGFRTSANAGVNGR